MRYRYVADLKDCNPVYVLQPFLLLPPGSSELVVVAADGHHLPAEPMECLVWPGMCAGGDPSTNQDFLLPHQAGSFLDICQPCGI